jgi:hypothetical protein
LKEEEIGIKILEILGGRDKGIRPKELAKKIGKEGEEKLIKSRLEGMRVEGRVKKGGGGYWNITEKGAKIIGISIPISNAVSEEKGVEKFEDLIVESKESLLKALKGYVGEIIGEIRKLAITGERGKEDRVPSLSELERVTMEEYPRLYVDSINAVRIPELRRSVKVKLGIDTDIFDELLIKLVEAGKYKMEEGSGDDGLRYRGRNFMYFKLKR